MRGAQRADFAAHFNLGMRLARLFQRDLRVRIFDLLRRFHYVLNRIDRDGARILVQLGAQVFLRLERLARRDDHGIFDRADHNLRIDALFAAQNLDVVVQITCHLACSL